MSLTLHSRACACCGDLLAGRFDRRAFLKATGGAGLLAAFPFAAFGASGSYDAMVLACIDPRFPEPTLNYMKERGLLGKYSQLVIAGAAIGVVAPVFKDWHKGVLGQSCGNERAASDRSRRRARSSQLRRRQDRLWR